MADEVTARRESDAGFTLIELMVAMGLFAIFLSILATAAVAFAGASTDARIDAQSSSSIGVAFQRIQRTVRYGDSINYPGTVSTRAYVEWHTTAQSSSTGVATCTQLRYDSTTGVVSIRSWPDTAAASTAPWATVLAGVKGAATTSYPFGTVAAVGGVTNFQGLTLTFTAGVDDAAGTSTSTTFYARNSSVNSTSNAVATSGQSAVPICAGTGYRP